MKPAQAFLEVRALSPPIIFAFWTARPTRNTRVGGDELVTLARMMAMGNVGRDDPPLNEFDRRTLKHVSKGRPGAFGNIAYAYCTLLLP
jgi:hypothetical protein